MSKGVQLMVRARMRATGESYGEAFNAIADQVAARGTSSIDDGRVTQTIQERAHHRKQLGCSICSDACEAFTSHDEFEGRCECGHSEEDHG